ncbi:hypothetical protein [Thermoactinospora rubra]|uniref:hypothetical protein n=1 Tax=Thermoactinospora rubra TaxID=1088767 RepID=UPI00117FB77C|nr:hypothetical protein [Thermoactinospora rubra]
MDGPVEWASCGEAWFWLMRHVLACGVPADDDRGPILEAPAVLFAIRRVKGEDPIVERYGDAAKAALYARKFTEDQVVAPFKYSYGERIHGQLDWATAVLRAKPYSKSAWISLTRQNEPPDRVPCLAGVAFRIRQSRLVMTAAFRSQNAYTSYLNYLPLADVQAEMARNLGLDTGPMRVFVDVPHLYQADLTRVWDLMGSRAA